jgi:KaiC/GvpD/RAD55 family RecA-like ATPase
MTVTAFRSFSNRLPELWALLTRPPERLVSGWALLDEFLGGGLIHPSLTVLGAEPKAGKSYWAQHVALHMSANGVIVMHFDLENGEIRYARRLLHMATGTITPSAGAVKTAQKVLEAKTANLMLLDDNRGLSPDRFSLLVGLARKHAGRDLPVFVVVDSLQKLPRKGQDARAAVDEWLRTFEAVRTRHNASILIVSELHRPKTGSEYRATGTSFKESGDIEYTADLALGFRAEKTGHLLDVLWNRDGAVGQVARYRLDYPKMIEEHVHSNSNSKKSSDKKKTEKIA